MRSKEAESLSQGTTNALSVRQEKKAGVGRALIGLISLALLLAA